MIVACNFGVRAREVVTSIIRRAMSPKFQPATQPTMYFIGVATAQSSINEVFPRWAERLQLGACELRGIDFSLRDHPEHYREAVRFIKQDHLSRGALVTSHKIDLCRACIDQFEGGTDEHLELDVEGGVPLTIVVDGWFDPGYAGPYVLNVAYTANPPPN